MTPPPPPPSSPPPDAQEETRERIADFFPEALRHALSSYKSFVEGKEAASEVKDFKEHHSAAKVAISHIELLLRLGEWARLGEKEREDQAALIEIVNEAQTEISSYHNDDAKEEEEE